METLNLIPCIPPSFAKGGHAQTIFGHLIPSPRLPSKGARREIPLSDGDRLVAHFFEGTSELVVYLFHGLAGDAFVDYMQRTALLCLDQNHSVYLVNHRGCGNGENLAVGPYHSGRGDDISEVIALGRSTHPDKKHLAIGFSLGANALLCLLTGIRGTVLPDFAIAVNAPIDIKDVSDRLNRGFSKVYQEWLMLALRANLKNRYRKGFLTTEYKVKPFSRIRDLDEIYTAPAGGFKNADQYYQLCSTHNHLTKITVPTFLLMSKDDPFIPYAPYEKAQLSSSVILHSEEVGGHLGYLSKEKTPLGTHRWLDYALSEVISKLPNRNAS